ncbi:MAG TPA: hypothetical protein VFY84_19555, partial [Jiangellales bacterium]|nr:hypothetical protein [Jiangellales bacterium]
ADEALADAYRDLNTWPRTWRLPTVPDDLKLATTPDGRVYERDVERPDRWYLVYGNGARTGAWLRLGQLLDLAGPDGIREAVPDG